MGWTLGLSGSRMGLDGGGGLLNGCSLDGMLGGRSNVRLSLWLSLSLGLRLEVLGISMLRLRNPGA